MGNIDSSSLTYLFPILLIVVFVVLIIVPNRRRDKKFKDMLSTLKVGDNIKTIGGVYGKIITIKEDLVTVETGPDKVKIVFGKSAIATVDRNDVESDVATTTKK
jgi:preprotein translocase subunit YajC